ncbi:MAG: hypothetical protein GVY19_01510 [Bacteroidetes bacterium]|jgi:hypothetical protein|nr:hypothetical protein [Bacteroidota bacterium]
MNKKIALLLATAFIYVTHISAQTVPTQDDVQSFFRTKTLVVLENNPLSEFNMIIQNVIKEQWKVTDYEFIKETEFEEKRKDPQYSFLYTTNVTFANDNTDAVYKFLHLSLGGDYFRMNQMPDLASVPISFKNVGQEHWAYKVGIFVRFIQNHVELIRRDPSIISNNVFNHYNENMGDVSSKTLFMLKSELAPEVNSLARIKQVYDFRVKLVEKEDIEEAIDNQDDNVVFLHKVGPEGTKLNARCYKILIGAADAKFYYFDYHKINRRNPDGFLKSDFKKLNRKN